MVQPIKIILAGGTGVIGAEILNQLQLCNKVTEVVCITRRPINASGLHAKVKQIVIEDFSQFQEHELAMMAGAMSCIWALGSKHDLRTLDQMDEWRKVDIAYPIAAARSFALALAADARFRFVYVSATGAKHKNWLRKRNDRLNRHIRTVDIQQWAIKYDTEKALVDLETEFSRFRSTVVRPPFDVVTDKLAHVNTNETEVNKCMGKWKTREVRIRLDMLAAAIVNEAVVYTGTKHHILQKSELVTEGRRLRCNSITPSARYGPPLSGV